MSGSSPWGAPLPALGRAPKGPDRGRQVVRAKPPLMSCSTARPSPFLLSHNSGKLTPPFFCVQCPAVFLLLSR